MKIMILAIVLAATGAFAGTKRRPARKPGKIIPAQLRSEPELKPFLELLGLEASEELTPEEQAQDAAYNKIIESVESAVESTSILSPIMLAICGDHKARRNGQQKFRLDSNNMKEVAEYNGKLLTAIELLTLVNVGEDLPEDEFTPVFNETLEVYVNEQVDDCIDGLEEDIHKENPKANITRELPERFQRDVVNRAKTILRDWNLKSEGKAEDRYWTLEQEENELSLERIYNEIERRNDPKVRNARGGVTAPRRSRVSI